tara:strand:+ start:1142 stop:1804 length:663 start_codon:yes stop_codon:yes gene_type:complete
MTPTTDFSIRTLIGGYDNNFTYIITCNITRRQIIIDASVKWEMVKPYINSYPITLVITHTHKDHIAYLKEFALARPNLKIIGHQNSEKLFSNYNFQLIQDSQSFNIGQINIEAIYTPGHYFDSICYLIGNVLFTGDTLFVGRTGRVLSPKSNIVDLYDSVYNKLLLLPHNTRIYPGHNYGKKKSITIGDNIKISPLLQANNFNDFKLKMTEYEKMRSPGS